LAGRREDIQTIVETIKRVGPRNCSLISRLTGIPTETVRYKIREQLVKKGFRIHAAIDFNKLGLERRWAILHFSDEHRRIAPLILNTLSNIGFLTYYARVIPQGYYVSIFSVPLRRKVEHRRFMNGLVKLGILDSYEVFEIPFLSYLSMRTEFYDFGAGCWRVDWREVDRLEVSIKETMDPPYEEPLADKKDILILKELQIDSMVSIAEIARRIRLPPKTVRYHFTNHVLRRMLITGYIIGWYGAVKGPKWESLLCMAIEVRGLTKAQLTAVQKVFRKLPFILFDAYPAEHNFYLAYLTLPIHEYVNILRYLSENLPQSGDVRVHLIDLSHARSFTIPYRSFIEGEGWVFNHRRSLQGLSRIVLPVESYPLVKKGGVSGARVA